MANAENIALVIQAIRGEMTIHAPEPVGFNMASYLCATGDDLEDKGNRGCGWIACIAGTAYLLATSDTAEAVMRADPSDIEAVAAGFIGLGDDEAAHLFYDLPEGYELKNVSAAAAINTLERLAETGAIEWRLN